MPNLRASVRAPFTVPADGQIRPHPLWHSCACRSLNAGHARRMDYPANAVFANDILFDLALVKAKAEDIEFGKRVSEHMRIRITEEMRAIINSGVD